MTTHSRRSMHRAGFTLAELTVVIVILGVMAAVVVATVPRTPPSTHANALTALEQARDSAVRTGVTVRGEIVDSAQADRERPIAFVARPDGSVIADSGATIDRLSGQPETRAR